MKAVLQITLGFLAGLALIVILSYAFGWINVHQTETIHKAKEDARREVYEQSQSYVEGKRQEALKYYREYQRADTDEKAAIREMVALSFANFDEDKLEGKIHRFVYNCKYGSEKP